MARTTRRRESRRAPERTRSAANTRTSVRTSSVRATGEPSAALLKASAWERAFVVKDFRRLGITVVAMLILLAIAGAAENALLR